MIKACLKKLISNYITFIKEFGTSKLVTVVVYIDNFDFFGPFFYIKINIIKLFLANQYNIKDVSSYEQFTRSKLE